MSGTGVLLGGEAAKGGLLKTALLKLTCSGSHTEVLLDADSGAAGPSMVDPLGGYHFLRKRIPSESTPTPGRLPPASGLWARQ